MLTHAFKVYLNTFASNPNITYVTIGVNIAITLIGARRGQGRPGDL